MQDTFYEAVAALASMLFQQDEVDVASAEKTTAGLGRLFQAIDLQVVPLSKRSIILFINHSESLTVYTNVMYIRIISFARFAHYIIYVIYVNIIDMKYTKIYNTFV